MISLFVVKTGMTTMAADRLFLDTNVLIQATQETAPLHEMSRQRVDELHSRGVEIWISRQVLREYLAVLSRPQTYTAPLSPTTLATRIQLFEASFHVVDEDTSVTQQLVSLVQQFAIGGRQVHDANIVATMLVNGIESILTHNTVDFARFASIITVIPLVLPMP